MKHNFYNLFNDTILLSMMITDISIRHESKIIFIPNVLITISCMLFGSVKQKVV